MHIGAESGAGMSAINTRSVRQVTTRHGEGCGHVACRTVTTWTTCTTVTATLSTRTITTSTDRQPQREPGCAHSAQTPVMVTRTTTSVKPIVSWGTQVGRGDE